MDFNIKNLFGDMFTKDHWKNVGVDMLTVIDNAATEFAKTNIAIAAGWTEDQLKGILFNEVLTLPPTQALTHPEDAPEEEILLISRINKARSSAHALVLDAQAQNNEQERQLEDNARKFAADVGKTLLTIVIGGVTSGLVNSAADAIQ